MSVAGVIVGAAVGAVVGEPVGAVIDGAIGAASGATAGALDDKRKDEEVVVTREEKRWSQQAGWASHLAPRNDVATPRRERPARWEHASAQDVG